MDPIYSNNPQFTLRSVYSKQNGKARYYVDGVRVSADTYLQYKTKYLAIYEGEPPISSNSSNYTYECHYVVMQKGFKVQRPKKIMVSETYPEEAMSVAGFNLY